MAPNTRKQTAWLLIAALAIISGAGEGLHFLPGCGHTIDVGNRVFVVGLDVFDHDMPINDRPCVERQKDNGIPLLDEDDCPICSILAQSVSPGGIAHLDAFLPFAQELPVAVDCAAPSSTPHLCLARAPPLA